MLAVFFFFFQAEDGIRDYKVTGVQTCALPIVALAAYCGLYVGAFTWAVSWIGRRRAPALALAAAPFLWVTGEWVRARLLGGFPWGTLGYSQYLRLPVIQVAELGVSTPCRSSSWR